MDEVVGRSKVLATPGTDVRLPVAHMVCNQSPPIGDAPSLMTFREVETVFHEFGHALQHMVSPRNLSFPFPSFLYKSSFADIFSPSFPS